MRIVPSGHTLGATIEGLDLASPMTEAEFAAALAALGRYGVLRFPGQVLDPGQLKAFAGRFGSLEIHVASMFQDPVHPQVMTLSNIKRDGQPIGLSDAGQDWHTDMSYSEPKGFANVLYGMVIPRRNGQPVGATEFADMAAAYDDLPETVRGRLKGAIATHDYNKFWEEMRKRPGSTRPPMSEAQRRRKPPVPQPMLLRHPVSGRMILYADPGYTVSIDGWDAAESQAMLDYLFEHQLNPKYRYVHHWTENDVVVCDNLRTLHNARPDYGPDEHRLVKRCQVMADRVFDPAFAAQAQMEPA